MIRDQQSFFCSLVNALAPGWCHPPPPVYFQANFMQKWSLCVGGWCGVPEPSEKCIATLKATAIATCSLSGNSLLCKLAAHPWSV